MTEMATRFYVLYDTVEMNSTTTELQFFKAQLGQAFNITTTVTKNTKHTNLRQNSQLPSNWSFEVHAIGMMPVYESLVGADIPLTVWEAAFCESMLEVKIQDEILLEAPAKLFIPGCGPNSAGTLAAGTNQIGNGMPTPEARFNLGNYPMILSGGNFEFNLKVTNSPTAALAAAQKIMLCLQGVLST